MLKTLQRFDYLKNNSYLCNVKLKKKEIMIKSRDKP